jgi:LPPG:FO 2-phospho-L-lactate transferase
MTLRVIVLAGGYGGAKLGHGVAMLAEASGSDAEATPRSDLDLSVIVNTGDDLELHGLLVCPDLDTVMYTLAGLANEATGWGVRDETWSAKGMLERYGRETWFALGDRDIGTHLARSKRMREGARLTEVTAELTAALGIQAHLLPMTDDIVRTKLRTDEGWLAFRTTSSVVTMPTTSTRSTSTASSTPSPPTRRSTPSRRRIAS